MYDKNAPFSQRSHERCILYFSKYFIGHQTFADYWNVVEFNKRSQNSINKFEEKI